MRLLLICDIETQTRQRQLEAALAVDIGTTVTSQDALEIAKRQRFDAILLWQEDGNPASLELLFKLRDGGVEASAMLLLGATEDDELAKHCFRAGAEDFLVGDEINPRRLRRAIHQARQRYYTELELRHSRERLRDLNERDALTGLTNRHGFEAYLRRAFASAQRQQADIAVILIDLDNFKQINDQQGYPCGDALLKTLAERLSQSLRADDMLARIGADEFVVLANAVERGLISALVKRLLRAVTTPVRFQDIELRPSAAIGVATSDTCATQAEELLRCADIAMLRSKRSGQNQIHYYSDKLHLEVRRRTDLEAMLRRALAEDQLELYYQPQFCTKTTKLAGMEALLRWQHPELGLMLPHQFLQIAEQTGLIAPIGTWVMRAACRQLQQWRLDSEAAASLTMAVNLSALQLRDQGLIRLVEQALDSSGLPSACLELEVTENALIDQPRITALSLQRLVQRGVRLALDDFGTGYSSLQHLRHFRVNTLKIDRSFVAAIGKGTQEEKMIAAVIRFAKILGIQTIAEGIETQQQYELCRRLGCNYIQGYYFARPMPAAQFETSYLSAEAGPQRLSSYRE